eukprot:NODE_2837_length_1081_cov_30.560797_g2706_i0.p1 GENE.NODE_2837_length_1081_cov_30.560797_g2706_i0~~NODE_2837_length_1081_cov_30.560797_g2706_i0.p1  ORF type:complete len:335 (-),score=71.94 NODE_2837_length_1081_cov_30.560797_g2706_i0:75-1025(-)
MPSKLTPPLLPIFHAAALGQLTALKDCLANGQSLTATDSSGCTALHHAATHGRLEMVKFLLDSGMDINAVSSGLITPLMCSATNGHEALTELLLERCADVLLESDSGHTACDYAHLRHHNTIAAVLDRRMLAHTQVADVWEAVRMGDLICLKDQLMNNKVDPQAQREGHTLLSAACLAGSVAVVRFLLAQHCIDPNAYTANGQDTPLTLACKNDQVPLDIFTMLVAHPSVKVRLCDHQGLPPLVLLMRADRRDCLERLLERHKELDWKDPSLWKVAEDNSESDILKWLAARLPKGVLKQPDDTPASEAEDEDTQND